MPRAIIIVGLCGSGKSHLATGLQSQGYVNLDEGFAADPGKLLSTAKSDELEKQLAQGKDCAFTEAMLMFEQGREEFEPCLKRLKAMAKVTVEWVFFAKDRETANFNCLNDPNSHRANAKGNIDLNNRWFKDYVIPAGETPRPIVRIPEKQAEEGIA